MYHLDLVDCILIALSIVFSWRLHHPAQPPPAGVKNEAALSLATPASPLPRRINVRPSEPHTHLGQALERICVACNYADIQIFTEGAKLTYEIVVQAFAAADIATCGYLLSDPVRDVFARHNAESAQRGETTELTFIGFRAFDIIDAQFDSERVWIDVNIKAESVSVTRKAEGQIVAGHPTLATTKCEIWTFERDLLASQSRWLLVATAVA